MVSKCVILRKVQVFPNAYFGRGTGPVLLSGLTCAGHEDQIDSCGSNGWYNTNSYCGHQYDVGVSCPGNNILYLANNVSFQSC